MPSSKSHIQASNRYNIKNYERIMMYVRKGEKDKIKARAQAAGLSMTAYIMKAVENCEPESKN